ncbi:hypothetical protein HAX54_025156, partial [Datura stramonium]|nr:hypothetical protein [Datura stramonium]
AMPTLYSGTSLAWRCTRIGYWRDSLSAWHVPSACRTLSVEQCQCTGTLDGQALRMAAGRGTTEAFFTFHLSCTEKAQSQSQGKVKLHRGWIGAIRGFRSHVSSK